MCREHHAVLTGSTLQQLHLTRTDHSVTKVKQCQTQGLGTEPLSLHIAYWYQDHSKISVLNLDGITCQNCISVVDDDMVIATFPIHPRKIKHTKEKPCNWPHIPKLLRLMILGMSLNRQPF